MPHYSMTFLKCPIHVAMFVWRLCYIDKSTRAWLITGRRRRKNTPYCHPHHIMTQIYKSNKATTSNHINHTLTLPYFHNFMFFSWPEEHTKNFHDSDVLQQELLRKNGLPRELWATVVLRQVAPHLWRRWCLWRHEARRARQKLLILFFFLTDRYYRLGASL